MKQLILNLIPAPRPTLDNFVPGRNGEALKTLLDAASGAATAKIIYLWGGTSSGKSHLVQSFSTAKNAPEFFDEYFGLLPETATQFVVDDVHSLVASRQIGVFNLINLINASDIV